MGRTVGYHNLKIEEFSESGGEDNDLVNGSSITFLLNYKNIDVLFLADGMGEMQLKFNISEKAFIPGKS